MRLKEAGVFSSLFLALFSFNEEINTTKNDKQWQEN